jgi:hypothetical protein
MTTYQFDFTVITDGDTEAEALEEAMQLMADYRFAKEAATVTVLEEGPHVPTDSPIQKVAALSADLRSLIEEASPEEADYVVNEAIDTTVDDLLDAIDAMLSEREGLS